jgi:hypothetical protein
MVTAYIGAAIAIMLMTHAVPTQSGGNFTIDKSVIASGGGLSSDGPTGTYRIEGTTGQNIAGTESSGPRYSVHGGFWSGFLIPTAAGVNVGGRVTDAGGNGIKDAVLTLTAPGTSEPARIARTNGFGYFNFEDVSAGEFYVLSISHKRFTFIPDTYAFNLLEELTDIIFQGQLAAPW